MFSIRKQFPFWLGVLKTSSDFFFEIASSPKQRRETTEKFLVSGAEGIIPRAKVNILNDFSMNFKSSFHERFDNNVRKYLIEHDGQEYVVFFFFPPSISFSAIDL